MSQPCWRLSRQAPRQMPNMLCKPRICLPAHSPQTAGTACGHGPNGCSLQQGVPAVQLALTERGGLGARDCTVQRRRLPTAADRRWTRSRSAVHPCWSALPLLPHLQPPPPAHNLAVAVSNCCQRRLTAEQCRRLHAAADQHHGRAHFAARVGGLVQHAACRHLQLLLNGSSALLGAARRVQGCSVLQKRSSVPGQPMGCRPPWHQPRCERIPEVCDTCCWSN